MIGWLCCFWTCGREIHHGREHVVKQTLSLHGKEQREREREREREGLELWLSGGRGREREENVMDDGSFGSGNLKDR
jgi:hypothetical protein